VPVYRRDAAHPFHVERAAPRGELVQAEQGHSRGRRGEEVEHAQQPALARDNVGEEEVEQHRFDDHPAVLPGRVLDEVGVRHGKQRDRPERQQHDRRCGECILPVPRQEAVE
jgi:hypothetical protein